MNRLSTGAIAGVTLLICLVVTPAVAGEALYSDAVEYAARPAADRERDAARQPAEVLAFTGIDAGMTVLDLFSGGGYYSELFSLVVGDTGHVDAHSNAAYLHFVGEEFEQRHADDRLGNVSVLMAENNELELESSHYDAVFLSLTFHDFYLESTDGWPRIDVDRLLAEIKSGLKPGGTITIIDHYAAAGAPIETAESLHRIDPAFVRDAMEAAGFELDAESDVLRNADDDHSKSVFDPSLRGRTDRFMLRYRKPG